VSCLFQFAMSGGLSSIIEASTKSLCYHNVMNNPQNNTVSENSFKASNIITRLIPNALELYSGPVILIKYHRYLSTERDLRGWSLPLFKRSRVPFKQ
jgi:hypothetical protein